jgi:thiamine pyrophosphate-dependent acetolactate synthase large subunit-like protein
MKRYGSDLIVDLLEEAGIEFVAMNPGATFRGIHDSLVHSETAPKIILCLHEAVAVAVAQGYAKATGRPMAVLLHNVVGLQNGSMAVYNAWCDRAPMLLMGGTGPKSKVERRPWIDWIHTANTQAQVVRDFVKWDDEPHDIASVPESLGRALNATSSVPEGPVYLCYDVALQEDELADEPWRVPLSAFPTPTPPAPSDDDVGALVDALRRAQRPAIVAGHVGAGAEGMAALGRLAEQLGAPVYDTGVRFPLATDHPLNATGQRGRLQTADVVLALDVDDLQLHLGADAHERGVQVLNVGLGHLRLRGWAHDYQALVPAHLAVTADADLAVGRLNAVLAHEPFDGASDRVAAISAETAAARRRWSEVAATAEAEGAIPLERLMHELGAALGDRPYTLANGTNARLEHRHWAMRRPGQYLGWHGGGGLGYGVGASIGAALAAGDDQIVVDVQADGDLLFLPSALWTAAHLGLRILFVVFNNRQYGNTVEHAMKIAQHRGRPDRRYVGSGIGDPPIDLAAMAASFGLWSTGPVTDPANLAQRLSEAVAVVEAGRPALVDVITPGF